jgi:hypothetical protein
VAATLYPSELQADAIEAAESVLADAATTATGASGDPAAVDPRQEAPARTDRLYDRIARALAQTHPTHVTVTRYQSLDAIGHYFLRYAMPSEFGDVSDSERQRLGAVLDHQYAVIDESIGRAMAALGPEDLLLVISGYGMEPLGPGKRLVERLIGDPDISGTHEARRMDSCSPTEARSRAAASSSAPRSWTSCRPSCISSACRLGGTWTATPAPTSFRRGLHRIIPSRLFRATTADSPSDV